MSVSFNKDHALHSTRVLYFLCLWLGMTTEHLRHRSCRALIQTLPYTIIVDTRVFPSCFVDHETRRGEREIESKRKKMKIYKCLLFEAITWNIRYRYKLQISTEIQVDVFPFVPFLIQAGRVRRIACYQRTASHTTSAHGRASFACARTRACLPFCEYVAGLVCPFVPARSVLSRYNSSFSLVLSLYAIYSRRQK